MACNRTDADIQRGPVDAVPGFRRTVDASTLILRGLGDIVANLTQPPVGGPVGIASTIGHLGSQSQRLIWFIGVISANLAVVNVLPIPPLDGGSVVIAREALARNRIEPSR